MAGYTSPKSQNFDSRSQWALKRPVATAAAFAAHSTLSLVPRDRSAHLEVMPRTNALIRRLSGMRKAAQTSKRAKAADGLPQPPQAPAASDDDSHDDCEFNSHVFIPRLPVRCCSVNPSGALAGRSAQDPNWLPGVRPPRSPLAGTESRRTEFWCSLGLVLDS